MSSSTAELMDTGMKHLIEKLGNVQAERFISVIQTEKFDYTKWQRTHFDGISSDEFNQRAVEYAQRKTQAV